MRYGLRVERVGYHSVPQLESVSWYFDCFAVILWATSHRGEGMPRCKMSHDATATRLESWRSTRRVLVLVTPPHPFFRHCRDDCIACRPWVIQVGAASSAGLPRCTVALTHPLLLADACVENITQ